MERAGLTEAMERIERIVAAPDQELLAAAPSLAAELLAIGESIMETWLARDGEVPTAGSVEGFRLLALHRQGARGDPSFNACRESCRELVYYHNLVRLDPVHDDSGRRLRLGALVARHVALFISSKLEVAGFGEFCCSSRPLRQHESPAAAGETR